MKYFLDTEFIDDGKTIDLISIGIVAEDGRKLYLQSCEFNAANASRWVQDNVFPHLLVCMEGEFGFLYMPNETHHAGKCKDNTCPWRTREQIKNEVLAFMDVEKYGNPELWGWCCAYDYVALCQLFGTMMDIPSGWPHYMRDLQHVLDVRGISDDELPQQEGKAHNALEDARHIKKLCEHVLKGAYGWGIK